MTAVVTPITTRRTLGAALTAVFVPGFLETSRFGTALRVLCPFCSHWHGHGASDDFGRGMYRPGDITFRRSHCPEPEGADYAYYIVVTGTRFRSAWRTPTGRVSFRYWQALGGVR